MYVLLPSIKPLPYYSLFYSVGNYRGHLTPLLADANYAVPCEILSPVFSAVGGRGGTRSTYRQKEGSLSSLRAFFEQKTRSFEDSNPRSQLTAITIHIKIFIAELLAKV